MKQKRKCQNDQINNSKRRKAYKDWCASQPGQVRELRRYLLVVAVGLWRRHYKTFERLLFRLKILKILEIMIKKI